jgi:hypothetical protein
MNKNEVEAILEMIMTAANNPDIDKLPSSIVLQVLAGSLRQTLIGDEE